jgi:hypothetical protein
MLCFIDLTTIAYFAWTYGMALHHRKSIQLHARYMASTAPLLLPPALARLLSGQHLLITPKLGWLQDLFRAFGAL